MKVLAALPNIAASAAAIVLVLYIVLRLWRTRPVIGWIVAIGVLARAGLGAALFLISYFEVGFLRHLQAGEGFWQLAPDARGYFLLAARAAQLGLDAIDPTAPSPAFLRALAIWMDVTGISPLGAVLFNTLFYALSAALIVHAVPLGRRTAFLPLIVGLGAYSFSPALVLFSSQALKDQFFAALIVLASVSTLRWTLYARGDDASTLRQWLWFGGVLLAVYAMAGVRAYFAVLTIVAFLLAAVVTLRDVRIRRWPFAISKVAICLVLLWVGLKVGGGAYYPYYEVNARGAVRSLLVRTLAPDSVSEPLGALERARLAFTKSGGATNIATEPRVARDIVLPPMMPPAVKDDKPPAVREDQVKQQQGRTARVSSPSRSRQEIPKPTTVAPVLQNPPAIRSTRDDGPGEIARTSANATPVTLTSSPAQVPQVPSHSRTVVKRLVMGLAILFVPVAVLRHFSLVDFQGGRGLLSVTDVDTAFLDITILLLLWVVVAGRRQVRLHHAYICYVVLLVTTCSLAMGYVVTNYGTMFRLRLLIAVPAWMIALGLMCRQSAAAAMPLIDQPVARISPAEVLDPANPRSAAATRNQIAPSA
jgi:hypothetical protein